MSFIQPFTAVIFDMDGTLVASTETDFLAWRKLYADYGRTLTAEEYKPLLGRRGAEIIQMALQLEGAEMDKALRQRLVYVKEIIDANRIYPIPFAGEFLNSLKKHPVKMALATSARRAKMEMVMQSAGLMDYFDVVVTAEEVLLGKPAPEIYIKAMEKLDVPAHECIVFEDAVSGVQAAKNAHMKCVAITTTMPASALHEADLVIDSFEGINFPDLCKRLSNIEGNR